MKLWAVYFRIVALLTIVSIGLALWFRAGDRRHDFVIPLAFGILLMHAGVAFFIDRKPLQRRDGRPIRVGSPMWKLFVLSFFGMGALTILCGAGPALADHSRAALSAATLVLLLSCVAFGATVCLMRAQDDDAGQGSAAALEAARVYAAYGRTAQAIRVLENAAAADPAHPEVQRKLAELRAPTHTR